MTTAEDKVKHYEKRIEALRKSMKKQQKIVNKQKRTARTKRLIEIGAAAEKVLGAEISKEELPKFYGFLLGQEQRGGYFTKAMGVEARSKEELTELSQNPPVVKKPVKSEPVAKTESTKQVEPAQQPQEQKREEELPDLAPTKEMPF